MGYPHFSADCGDFHDRVIDWGRPKQPNPDCPAAPEEHHSYQLLSTQLNVQYWQCNWVGDATKPCGTRFEVRLTPFIQPRGIITLCGSSRFRDEINAQNKRLALEGYLVLSLGLFGHDGDLDAESVIIGHPVKDLLDALHKRKIDMSDAIYVVDVDDYIGESTQSEINYARKHNKPIHFMSEGNL